MKEKMVWEILALSVFPMIPPEFFVSEDREMVPMADAWVWDRPIRAKKRHTARAAEYLVQSADGKPMNDSAKKSHRV